MSLPGRTTGRPIATPLAPPLEPGPIALGETYRTHEERKDRRADDRRAALARGSGDGSGAFDLCPAIRRR